MVRSSHRITVNWYIHASPKCDWFQATPSERNYSVRWANGRNMVTKWQKVAPQAEPTRSSAQSTSGRGKALQQNKFDGVGWKVDKRIRRIRWPERTIETNGNQAVKISICSHLKQHFDSQRRSCIELTWKLILDLLKKVIATLKSKRGTNTSAPIPTS